MSVRMPIAFLVLLLLVQASAKNKKKQVLPEDVLRAQTVAVVIRPEAGEPLTSPNANRTAQTNVENAITKCGRFKVIMNAPAADLIIAVRTGHANGPTIHNSPADRRPNDYIGDIPDASQQGRSSPDLTNSGRATATDRRPHISNEMGLLQDSFEVYRGRVEYPLDAPAVWRYVAKDALDDLPEIVAVEQFRNAINEAERRSQQKP
ncbi:MAG TPA: hypothetical protein VMQ17_15435 [Candidatus Sulfotelmatobacter sp.]|nr:hypothetical protein [Candidatus Sulfotelmatobacter sp.]